MSGMHHSDWTETNCVQTIRLLILLLLLWHFSFCAKTNIKLFSPSSDKQLMANTSQARHCCTTYVEKWIHGIQSRSTRHCSYTSATLWRFCDTARPRLLFFFLFFYESKLLMKCILLTNCFLDSSSGPRGQEIPHWAEGNHGAGWSFPAVREREGPDLETAPRLSRDLPSVAAQAAALRQVEQTRGHGPGLMRQESRLFGFHTRIGRAALICRVTQVSVFLFSVMFQ